MKERNFEKVLVVANSLTDEIERLLKSGKTTIPKKYFPMILKFMNKVSITSLFPLIFPFVA